MHRFFPGLCGVFLLATQAFTIMAHAVTLAVPENLAPWGLAASQPPGQRGIYADLADALAKESHTPIEVRFLPYGRMLQEIKLEIMPFRSCHLGELLRMPEQLSLCPPKVDSLLLVRSKSLELH